VDSVKVHEAVTKNKIFSLQLPVIVIKFFLVFDLGDRYDTWKDRNHFI